MTQFFLSVHWEKKLTHFDLKSWVTGGTKIRPDFLGQNDSIFSLSAREKIESFDPKSWVTGGTKFWPKKIGSNFGSASDSTFKVKMTQIFLSMYREKNWVIFT